VSAEKGLDIDLDRLYVKHAIANDGPRMKRIRPAPMGRAFRYQRRISHLEVVLAEKISSNGHGGAAGTSVDTKPAKKVVKKAPVKKAAAKKAPAKKVAGKKTAKK
jgi:large subunit ribosomal protein L22